MYVCMNLLTVAASFSTVGVTPKATKPAKDRHCLNYRNKWEAVATVELINNALNRSMAIIMMMKALGAMVHEMCYKFPFFPFLCFLMLKVLLLLLQTELPLKLCS